jgi:hypothetical protein
VVHLARAAQPLVEQRADGDGRSGLRALPSTRPVSAMNSRTVNVPAAGVCQTFPSARSSSPSTICAFAVSAR